MTDTFMQKMWCEYDCPIQGIDFDVEPLPAHGTEIECSACGERHKLTSAIATAHRTLPEDPFIEDVTYLWEEGKLPETKSPDA